MGVVYEPPVVHTCRPGWTLRVLTESLPPFFLPVGTRLSDPPTPWNYPAGTVVECDCGKTHVSLGSVRRNTPGMCFFRSEGRFERWRRERRQARV
jgi:hypothetical protein